MFAAIMVLLGVGSALWIGVPAYRQQTTLGEIHRLRGYARFEPRGPKWLRDFIGEERMEMFDDVIQVHLTQSEASDTTLMLLSRLSKLETLHLCNTRVTDDGLVHLKGMQRMRSLSLRGTKVSDSGLVHLKSLVGMTGLYIGSSKVTDSGIADLKRALPELTVYE
jgi:hypothetical protein